MEATNGSFVYRDALFADVGGGKRFPRATQADLNALLLPKKNATPIKDETANFYIAQLMHYGLQKTKDKNTAKVRLTGALSTGQLVVPCDIRKVETDLQKEYASIQRKAKLAVQNEERDELTTKPAAGQRRKAETTSTETSISFTVGDISVQIHRSDTLPAFKKQKKEASISKTSPKKPANNALGTKTSKASNASPPKLAKPKAITKTSTQTPKPAKARQPASSQSSRPVQTARRSKPPGQYVSSGEEDAPPPYSEYQNMDEDDYYDQTPRPIQISGEYDIDAPAHDNNTTVKLRLSHPRDQLWSTFFAGDRQGVLRTDHTSDIGRGIRKSFGWRSEDTETEGDLRFGKNCDGWMGFDGHGGVQGVFFGFKISGRTHDVSFRGTLTEDYSYESDDDREDILSDLERDWHAFAERAYGR